MDIVKTRIIRKMIRASCQGIIGHLDILERRGSFMTFNHVSFFD